MPCLVHLRDFYSLLDALKSSCRKPVAYRLARAVCGGQNEGFISSGKQEKFARTAEVERGSSVSALMR